MVPPPENMGDMYPDFENMSPEEQMAWLESLARRQGANQDEFTTSADMDVAEVSDDVVIDEPGYVPYQISEKPRQKHDAPAATPDAPMDDEVSEPPAAADATPAGPAADPFGVSQANPMQWLDALSAQPEDDLPDMASFSSDAFDESGADLDDLAALGIDLAAELDELEPPAPNLSELSEMQSGSEAARPDVSDSEVGDWGDVESGGGVDYQSVGADDTALAPTDAASGDDPLGGMDPMLWLESLAARQGARRDELVTNADLEIDAPPEDAVIDEPGYVPYDVLGNGGRDEQEDEEIEDSAAETIAHERATSALIDERGDSMSDDVVSDLETDVAVAAVEAAAQSDVDEISALDWDPATLDEEAAALEPPPAAVTGDPDDPLGGMDPMKWLESLAKRQGASADSLTTSADIDVPEVSPETVVDEPGYVPFSEREGLRKEAVATEELTVESVSDASDATQGIDESEPELLEEAPDAFELAAPAPPEADLIDVGMAQFAEAEALEETAEADDSLAWLEALAVETDADMTDLLGIEGDLTADLDEMAAEPVADSEIPGSTRDLSTLSDEQVAELQARGELTPEEELEWLKRKASQLAEVRTSQEIEVAEMADEAELDPAEPGEIPSWLEDMRGAVEPDETEELSVDAESSIVDAFDLDDLQGEIDELPDWLQEPVEATEPEIGVSELELDADVDSLWAETPEDTQLEPTLELATEADVSHYVRDMLAPGEPDPLAEALDAEYERKLAGDDSEPVWYREAVEKAQAEAIMESPISAVGDLGDPLGPPDESVGIAGESGIVLSEATPVEMPDWLQAEAQTLEAAPTGNIPDWLNERVDAEEQALPGEMPDWLVELQTEQEADTGDLGWLATGDEPEADAILEASLAASVSDETTDALPLAEASFAAELPGEVGQSATRDMPADLPAGELFDQYRQRLEQDANDAATRLSLARALRANDEAESSLDQYEYLIETAQLLPDVSADLQDMSAGKPNVPRIQRLLGDSFMRRGFLQDALEAYRVALDHL